MAGPPFGRFDDVRAEPRDEVLYRTRLSLADRRQFAATVVNISPGGMMIRTDAPVSAGEWVRMTLPVTGDVVAAVRWALGGRIGCSFDRPIAASHYHAVLAAMAA